MREYVFVDKVLLNLDNVPDTSGDTFDRCSLTFADELDLYPQPVWNYSPVPPIGHVKNLKVVGTQFRGTIVVTDQTYIKMLMAGANLYPSVNGFAININNTPVDVLGSAGPTELWGRNYNQVQIDNVSLTTNRNADHRIPPIYHQIPTVVSRAKSFFDEWLVPLIKRWRQT